MALTNGKNGHKKDRLDRIEELLNMAALQTAENARQLAASRKEHDREMKEIRAEHKRGMNDIRVELKNLIKRIAL